MLRLIAQTIEGAHAHQRHAGICGGVAGDLHAVPILVGLGIDELSVSLPAIPDRQGADSPSELTACRELAQRALQCATAEEVRALSPETENRAIKERRTPNAERRTPNAEHPITR